MSRYKNLSTERKRCWRSHKIQNETATTTDAGKKEFVCSSLEISLQCLNCSYLDVVYKKNILSIRWLHLTILIALFYFIYLNQLHHFLLYRNFHTLFFVLQLNESDHPSNQLLFFPLHPQRWIWACRCWCAWVFFFQRKRFDFVLKTFLLFSSSFGLLVCDESTKGMIKKKEDRENWERQIDR